MTIKDLLYRELHGEENLKAKAIKKEVSSCVNEDFDFFVGTKRVSTLLEGVSESLPYMAGINRAISFLKVYESKVLKEQKITPLTASILLHDIMTGLNESVNTLEKSVLSYKNADKEKLSKIYSTILFEAQQMGEKYGVSVEDLRVENTELRDSIERDFFAIGEEIL